MHSITRRDESGGGREVRRQWEGGGGRLLCANLYMSWVKWYDNTYTFQLYKKGLLLTAIQIRGKAETRRCGADAVRLQVITWNPPLTLCASYLPLPPPPSSAPCSQSRSLSPPLLIQHMVYRGVPKQFPLTKIIGTLTFDESFQSPFSLLLYTRTFFTTPLAEKCTPFFCQSLIRESFSRFLLRCNFSPFLKKCQLFISKDF